MRRFARSVYRKCVATLRGEPYQMSENLRILSLFAAVIFGAFTGLYLAVKL